MLVASVESDSFMQTNAPLDNVVYEADQSPIHVSNNTAIKASYKGKLTNTP